jgi:hypothetical protein
MAQPPPQACGHDDCAQIPVLRLEGTRFANGTVATSTLGGTLGFVGVVLEGAYAASEDTITLDGTTSPASCESDRLKYGPVVYHRACPQLATALEAARTAGWSAQPLEACR